MWPSFSVLCSLFFSLRLSSFYTFFFALPFCASFFGIQFAQAFVSGTLSDAGQEFLVVVSKKITVFVENCFIYGQWLLFCISSEISVFHMARKFDSLSVGVKVVAKHVVHLDVSLFSFSSKAFVPVWRLKFNKVKLQKIRKTTSVSPTARSSSTRAPGSSSLIFNKSSSSLSRPA